MKVFYRHIIHHERRRWDAMGRGGRRRGGPRWRVMPGLRLLGVVLLAAGMALLFLCVPGWAWAALLGAAMVVIGLLLATSGG